MHAFTFWSFELVQGWTHNSVGLRRPGEEVGASEKQKCFLFYRTYDGRCKVGSYNHLPIRRQETEALTGMRKIRMEPTKKLRVERQVLEIWVVPGSSYA